MKSSIVTDSDAYAADYEAGGMNIIPDRPPREPPRRAFLNVTNSTPSNTAWYSHYLRLPLQRICIFTFLISSLSVIFTLLFRMIVSSARHSP